MAIPLADRSCTPPPAGATPLTAERATPLLAELRGWSIEQGKRLVKSYTFANFVDAVAFVNRITPVAEEQGHHPDLLVSWGKVGVTLSTHSIGGLSESDFIMAAKIDHVFAAMSPER